MSLTLHTTEIWLNTHTDSGGMKDRTHGIFLQEDSGRESTNPGGAGGDLVWFAVQKWVSCNLKRSGGATGTA